MTSEINNRIAKLAVMRALKGYTWNDIADQINVEFGTMLSGDACRKRASYTILVDETEPVTAAIDDEFEDPRAPELQILNTIKDERIQANALFRRMDREETLKQIARESAEIIAKSKPFINISRNTNKITTANEALLLISDWHYGVDVDNYLNTYNPEICKQRVGALINEVIEKVECNGITTLHILNLGDMIAGLIHLQLRINSRMDVMSQIMEVSEVIAEMLYTVSKHVDVKYYQVLDNHSRIDPNKKESLQLESLARLTPWYLNQRLRDIPSIQIMENDIDEDIAMFYVNNDYLIVGLHGDKDKKATLIPKIKSFIKEDPALICSAHLHHFSMDEDNRTVLISNGSLMGTDEFAFSKRLDSKPSQTFVTFKNTIEGTDIDGIYKMNSYI